MSTETSTQRWHQSHGDLALQLDRLNLVWEVAQPVRRRLKLGISPRVRQIAV